MTHASTRSDFGVGSDVAVARSGVGIAVLNQQTCPLQQPKNVNTQFGMFKCPPENFQEKSRGVRGF